MAKTYSRRRNVGRDEQVESKRPHGETRAVAHGHAEQQHTPMPISATPWIEPPST